MKKDIIWNSLGTGAWSFLSLILLIVVTRINGIEASGMFSFAFAYAIIMFTVACYGGRTYQVSDHHNQFSNNEYVTVRLLTSLMVIPITVIFIVVNGYDLQKSLLILLLVSHRIFDAIADVLYGILQKAHRLHVAGKSLLFKSILSFLLFLIIDSITKNILAPALMLPFVSLAFIILYDLPHARKFDRITFQLKTKRTKAIITSTFLPFAITAMSLVFVNLARYFIDIYHPELQGYFGIIIMPLSLVILLFSFILTPTILHLSDHYNHRRFIELRKTVSRIVSTVVLIAILLASLMYFLGAPLLHILFGISFEHYVLDIVLVMAIGLFVSLVSLFTNIAIIARGLRLTALISLAAIIILALLSLELVGKHQIRGAIIAYIIASIVQALAMAAYYMALTRPQSFSKNS